MSNFFRDNNIVFKPRRNIFSKLRNPKDGESDVSNSSSIMDNPFFNKTDDSMKISTPNDKQTIPKDIMRSTPTSSPIRNLRVENMEPEGEEEGELEITEVREVTLPALDPLLKNTGKEEEYSELAANTTVNASSNDVLLEAFTNTQRICSKLKLELQRQQQKNGQQKEQIDQYKSEISNMSGKIGSHRNLLTLLEEQMKALKQNKSETDILISELSSNYTTLSNKVKTSTAECESLKSTLHQQKSYQKNLEFTIQQKKKELDYLKKELDNCSGQLSEEKIKYNELLQQITTSKTEITATFRELFAKNGTEVITNIEDLQNRISTSNSSIEDRIKEHSVDIKNTLVVDFNTNKEFILTELDKQNNIFTELTLETKEIIGNETKKMFKGFTDVNTALTEMKSIFNKASDQSEELIKTSFDLNKKSLEEAVSGLSSDIQNIPKILSTLDQKIASAANYESQINSLKEQLQSVMLQKTEVVSLLKSKDHEIEELNTKIFLKTHELDELSSKDERLQNELITEKRLRESSENDLSQLKKESDETTASLHSKLSAKTEIASLLEKELETSKQELQTANRTNNQINEELQAFKSKIDTLQQQFQKVNVELVQSKAKELELEEINRSLKEQFDELETTSNQTSGSVIKLNDKIHQLEKDKSSLNLEKLSLLDKIDELENKLKGTNNQKRTSVVFDHLKQKNNGNNTKSNEDDAFALSSDDLELTNPEFSLIKPIEPCRMPSKLVKSSRRKKLLLSDDMEESSRLKRSKRFK